VLLVTSIFGVWRHELKRRRLTVELEPFGRSVTYDDCRQVRQPRMEPRGCNRCPLPAAAFVMSSYADLTLAGTTMETRREVDPLLSRETSKPESPP